MKLKTLLKELDATQTDENLDKIVGIFNCFVSKKITDNMPTDAANKMRRAAVMFKEEGL